MRRIFLEEAIEARPIITRLLENLGSAVDGLVDSHNTPKGVTVKQFRQNIDLVIEETVKLKNRVLAAENQLQIEAAEK